MKQNIDRDFVKRLAAQAMLDLGDDQLDTYAEQFKDILGQIDQLQAVDTEGVKPTYMVVEPEDAMRDDIPHADQLVSGEELLKLAPEAKDGYIVSKRVL